MSDPRAFDELVRPGTRATRLGTPVFGIERELELGFQGV
jgi:hypothetical protein